MFVLLVCIVLYLYMSTGVSILKHDVYTEMLILHNSTLVGVGALTLASVLILYMLRFYFNTFYFYGFYKKDVSGITYEVAKLCKDYKTDLTRGLYKSPAGKLFMIRLGLYREDFVIFLSSERQPVGYTDIELSETQYTFADLVSYIYKTDKDFNSFLKKEGITDEMFEGAADWVYTQLLQVKRIEQWWSYEMLSTARGLGSNFSFGVPYTLQRFTKPIASKAIFSTLGSDALYGLEHVQTIETILARSSASNVLLVGEPGVGKMDILMQVARRMESGHAKGSISGKYVMVLDTELLLSHHETKMELEQTLLQLLTEAAHAGNIILVIDDVHSFATSALALDVDVSSLFDPYLNDASLHIVATTSPSAYHSQVETKTGFLRRFQTVLVEEPTHASTVHLLQNLVYMFEVNTKVRFTYSAVHQIAVDAERYIVNGVMPDKAVQLLDAVFVYAQSNRISLVQSSDVDVVVSRKTGIPVGPVDSAERDILINLEEVLHERIVGQERAISSIAGVIRRSRAGIQDEQKPIGSFLFLGPTGVGKTECAKALATVFFKSEDAMHRIDMSEFSGQDAVERLIGNQEGAGVLANMLKEHPYSVVLLDEFEKASTAVHDLFLQIIDEGIFTDGGGHKVNARNSILIATSNAGSQNILSWVSQGRDLTNAKDELIAQIIKDGTYKPELINRFDDAVVFEPLNKVQQAAIAQAMLGALQERIKKKGFALEVTPKLIETLVRIGYKPEFGARPMRRAIQEVVEEAIAEKIIEGSLTPGQTVTFSADELEAFEV